MSQFSIQDINLVQSRRCVAYCTASSYDLKLLFESLKTKYKATSFKDVIYFDLSANPDPASVRDVFCFSYGVCVLWGFEEGEEPIVLQTIKPFEVNSQDAYERETMNFSFGTHARIIEDEIELPDYELLSRLAVSHGLAQSVRLATFEITIQKTIDKTKNIPEHLALRGKIPLSKKEIRKKMGELFIERSSVNLHFDILDIPEFFWEHSELEPMYTMIAKHLDLGTRLEVLNQKLDTVHDLFEMLGNELNHQHSSKLEWIIIWLIVIEVVLTLLRDVFELI
jgi:uncharacterized Rmd1/YagE family protein